MAKPGGAHGGADRGCFATWRAKGPRASESAGHALVAARAGVGVGRLADLGLLGVLEFAAVREREEVHPGAREGDAEEAGVVDAVAALDDSSQRKRQPSVVRRRRARARRRDLERQPDALLARAAVAVRARVQRREERRHRVGVREVQLDAVEAGLLRARAAASAKRPGSTRGSSRMCGAATSVTRSREPQRAPRSRARSSTASSVASSSAASPRRARSALAQTLGRRAPRGARR